MEALKKIRYFKSFIKGYIIFIVLLGVLAYANGAAHGANMENQSSPLGTNLYAFNSWSPEWVFIDIFPKTNPWFSIDCNTWETGPELNLDSNGWITRLEGGNCANTTIMYDIGGHYPAGEYVLLWEGEGTFLLEDGEDYYFHNQGEETEMVNGVHKATINITNPSSNGIFFLIFSTDENDYIRNVRLLMPGGLCGESPQNLDYFKGCQSSRGGTGTCDQGNTCYDFEEVYWDRYTNTAAQMNKPNAVFHPTFLNRIQKYNGIRYMNWMSVTNSTLVDWEDRPMISKYSYADDDDMSTDPSRGIPYEYMIALSNVLNADAWFNIPAQTNDEFSSQFAQMVKRDLNTNLKVYIEYSNEVWNTDYMADYNHVLSLANAPGSTIPSDDSDQIKIAKAYSERIVDIANIWTTEFGSESNRLIRVLSGFAPLRDYTDAALNWQDAYQSIDSLAISGYFGGELNDYESLYESIIEEMTLDDVFNEIFNGGLGPESALGEMDRTYRFNKDLANAYGLNLIAYEGGQDLKPSQFMGNLTVQELFSDANEDPRMGDAYRTNLDYWRSAGGDTFFHFNNCARWDEYGTFGALRYQDQPREESVKYDAIMTYIENNSCWWTDCTKSIPVE